MEEKSCFENIFALFFPNNHEYIPAGFSCQQPAQRREGNFKYLGSGLVPPLPTSMCPGSLGVTSTFILAGMLWERGFLSSAGGLSDWVVTLCSSPTDEPLTDQPRASAVLSLLLCGERRFSTAGDRRFLTLQTKPARKKKCLILRQLKRAIVFIPRALSALNIRSM